MAVLLQGFASLQCTAADVIARDAVSLEGNDFGLPGLEQLARKHFTQKTPDH
jgi:hypothetical protein